MQFMADSDLSAFLASLGLSRYVPLFDADEVDMESLALLQPHDYEQMGVPRGPRLKIQAALQSISDMAPSSNGGLVAPSPRPLYDRIVSTGRTTLGDALLARSPPPQQARTVAQHKITQSLQMQQPAVAGVGTPVKVGGHPGHTDVSRILNLSPQSAAPSFAASTQTVSAATVEATVPDQIASHQQVQRRGISPIEREAQDFLSEMDSLLAQARERLQQRSSRQLPPAVGVSNLSTISFRSGDHHHQHQLPSRESDYPVETSTSSASSLTGDHKRAVAATKTTSPSIPAIFNTELTSSSDESDDNTVADLAVSKDTAAAERPTGSEAAGGSQTVNDQELQKPLEGHQSHTPTVENLTNLSADKVASTIVNEPTQAGNRVRLVNDADEADRIRLEVVALAAKRTPEEASADRSAPQIERTIYVGHLPEALAFFDVKLKTLFERFGKVISVTSHHVTVHHKHDTKHHRSKNWGLVTFADALSAREAVRRGVEVQDKDENNALCKLSVRNLDSDQDQDALHVHHQQHLAKTDAQDDLGWLT